MTSEKKVYLVTAAAVCLMILFPPVIGYRDRDEYLRNPFAAAKDVGYKPIFELLEPDRFNQNRIIVQVLAVLIIGGVASRLVKD